MKKKILTQKVLLLQKKNIKYVHHLTNLLVAAMIVVNKHSKKIIDIGREESVRWWICRIII